MSASLEHLITLAIVSHNNVHDGEFLECHDEGCEEIRIDLMALIGMERDLDAIQEAVA